LTLLFNEGHTNANVEDTFSYKNVQTWLSKKMQRSKTSLKRMTGYHSAGFYDPYSDDNSILDDKKEDKDIDEIVDDKKEDEDIEEVLDLLINLKTADGLPTDKTKAKPTKNRKTKQSIIPLQAPLSSKVEEKPKPRRRTSPRRAELLTKKGELVRAEALSSQNAVAETVGQKAVAEDAYYWLKKPQLSPKK
jgi:hypothetical protein